MITQNNPLLADFSDPEVCFHYLDRVKHTRLEGLIIEYEFDQVFTTGLKNAGWAPVDCLVLRRFTRDNHEDFLVLPRNEGNAPELFINQLEETGIPVRMMNVDKGQGVVNIMNDRDGNLLFEPITIQPESWTDPAPSQAISIRDRERIRSIYWGIGKHLEDRFVTFLSELIIKDYFIQPHSKYLWDLDKFFISPDGGVVFIEIKHKYPTKNLTFGMNRGEVKTGEILLNAGFYTWHVILIKPHWDKMISSMYLFFDREARENALWVAGNMGDPEFFNPDNVISADSSTSLYGSERIGYSEIPLSSFQIIGNNSKDVKILSDNLITLLLGRGEFDILDRRKLLELKMG